jgi:hypothetical protein
MEISTGLSVNMFCGIHAFFTGYADVVQKKKCDILSVDGSSTIGVDENTAEEILVPTR